MTPDDDGDPCPHCGGEGYIDDPLSSACGGRWFRYCDCPVGEAASEEDSAARVHRFVVNSLEKRLWDSDDASPLTHEAAREIERLNWKLDRLNRAMPEALALIMFDDLKRQHDASRAFGIGWLDGAAGLTDVEIEGHVDLVSMAQAVLNALKEPS